jgi:phosphatidylglycerophosphate synthase
MEYRKELFNIPNTLSLSRIVLLPLLYLLVLIDWKKPMLIFYIVIASTDYLDGKFARRFNQSTELGKTLDSVADLLFYLSTAFFFYYLFPDYLEPLLIPLWIVIGILAFTFIFSWIRIGKPTIMHTTLLRYSAFSVMAVFCLSFFFDTTPLVAVAMIMYSAGFLEEILIWSVYGDVDRDTRSFLDMYMSRRKGIKGR